MIISASRRTDIPTWYSRWFVNRVHAGFADVRNPMNPRQVSRVDLSPRVVDAIVFWTKNPLPMMPLLPELGAYMYYFQFTLNAYGRDVEARVPDKADVMIPAFQELARRIGPERVVWRYDPIFLTPRYTTEYHVRAFGEMARRLEGYTQQCVISFLDLYRHTRTNMKGTVLLPMGEAEMRSLARQLADIARRHGMVMTSCAEAIDLQDCGVAHGRCIDGALLERLLGQRLDAGRDAGQREHCGCMASIDIGMYSTCRNGCSYCYANHVPGRAEQLAMQHDPASTLLIGHVGPEDHLTQRAVRSLRQTQLGMFDGVEA